MENRRSRYQTFGAADCVHHRTRTPGLEAALMISPDTKVLSAAR